VCDFAGVLSTMACRDIRNCETLTPGVIPVAIILQPAMQNRFKFFNPVRRCITPQRMIGALVVGVFTVRWWFATRPTQRRLSQISLPQRTLYDKKFPVGAGSDGISVILFIHTSHFIY